MTTAMADKIMDQRKEKLLHLKRREEMKDALNEELKAQYSARGVPSQRIEREVQNFIRCAGMTERNLKRLERRLDKQVERPKDDDSMSLVSGISAYSARSTMSTMSGISAYSKASKGKADQDESKPGWTATAKAPPAHGGDVKASGTAPQGGLGIVGAKLAPLPEESAEAKIEAVVSADQAGYPEGEKSKQQADPFQWSDLDRYAALLHERDAAQQKEQVQRLQSELRKDLDQQVADARIRKQRERESDSKYHQSQMSEIEKWKELEKERQEDQKKKYETEKAERDAQLQHMSELRGAENEMRIAEDKKQLEKISHEIELERRNFEQKRKAIKLEQKEFFKTCVEEEERKRLAKLQEQEADTEAMKAYVAMLDKQEKRRSEDLDKRMNSHQAFMDRLKDSGVLNEAEDKVKEEDDRVAREQAAADARAKEVEQNKRETLKSLRKETQDYLFEQMREKANIKKNENEEKSRQKKFLEADTEDFHVTEKQKSAARRERRLDHRRELEAQIGENQKPFPGLAVAQRQQSAPSENDLSKTEMALNKRLVDDVRGVLSVVDAK